MKGMYALKEESYVESLENLLIFMCQRYEETQKVLLKLSKEQGNNAFFEVPMIQGTGNVISISRLADLSFAQPIHGFSVVYENIMSKREE